jgi:hypothetical protein
MRLFIVVLKDATGSTAGQSWNIAAETVQQAADKALDRWNHLNAGREAVISEVKDKGWLVL